MTNVFNGRSEISKEHQRLETRKYAEEANGWSCGYEMIHADFFTRARLFKKKLLKAGQHDPSSGCQPICLIFLPA